MTKPKRNLRPIPSARQTSKQKAFTAPTDPYDENDFVFDASDSKGHARRSHRFDMPPNLAARVRSVVDSPDTPYRSDQDFYRDAVYHRLHYIERRWPRAEMTEEIASDLARMRFDHIIGRIQHRVAWLTEAGQRLQMLQAQTYDPLTRRAALIGLRELRLNALNIEPVAREELLRRIDAVLSGAKGEGASSRKGQR